MLQKSFGFDGNPDHDTTTTLACGEMPQARFERFGVSALSDTELLALVLHTGMRGRTLLNLASRLIAEAGTIARLASWNTADYERHPGIGPGKAKQLVAMAEIARRMMMPSTQDAPLLNKPELVAEFMRPYVSGLEVEKFWVVCMNTKNRLKKLVEVTTGTATSSLAHPREVFRSAIQYGATAIACVHNHPSGDPAPSSADLHVTRQLREASHAVDITLLDHVIIGATATDPRGVGYYSFRQAGLL